MASSPITSWQIDGETVETVTGFILLGSKITADGDCSHEIKRCLLLGRKALTNLSSVQFSSVTQSCLTLCNPMDCGTPGFPVLHHLLELAQIMPAVNILKYSSSLDVKKKKNERKLNSPSFHFCEIKCNLSV